MLIYLEQIQMKILVDKEWLIAVNQLIDVALKAWWINNLQAINKIINSIEESETVECNEI